jgi:uncharacterized membrane protein
MRTKDIRSVIYLAAGFGLIAAIYAYIETIDSSLQSSCNVNSFVSCGTVAKSGMTTVLGIPDAFIGIGGFVLLLLLAAVAESRRRELLWPYLLFLVATVGVAFSLYFVYVELALIHALCPVCLTAWVFGWVAWVGSFALLLRVRQKARSRAVETSASTSDSSSKRSAESKKDASSAD